MNVRMNEWLSEWMNNASDMGTIAVNGFKNKWINEQTKQWTDEQMNEWMNNNRITE